MKRKDDFYGKKGVGYKWLASIYYSGDGPVMIAFDTRKERDRFVEANDRCNKDGKIRDDHFFREDGTHNGTYAYEKDGKFYEYGTGWEI